MIFNTISFFSSGTYKMQKSEFLSFVFPCKTKIESEKILSDYKKKYNNARHICWAISLFENTYYDFSDDGEPGGTAGSAILTLIKSYSLFNVLIIVVRYFGGVKLGTKNLTIAYRQAVIDALEKNKIIQDQNKIFKEINIPPSQSYKLLNLLKRYGIDFTIQKEENFDKITFAIPDDQISFLEEKIKILC